MSNFLLSVLSGIIGGLYSGFIIYKYAVFSDNIRKVMDILNDFEYTGDENYSTILPTKLDRNKLLTNISMSFSTHGYSAACTSINEIKQLLLRAKFLSDNRQLKTDEVESINNQCYDICNSLSPNLLVLFLGKKISTNAKGIYEKCISKHDV